MNGFLQKQTSVRRTLFRRDALLLLAAVAFVAATPLPAHAYRNDHHDRTASFGDASDQYKSRQRHIKETSPAFIGTLDKENGGFSPDIWAKITTDKAIALMNALPDVYGSSVQRQLAQKLLASAAQLPSDAKDNAEKTDRFLVARIEKLKKMGALGEAADLYATLPDRLKTPAVQQAGLETLFDAGMADAACLEIYAQEPGNSGEFYSRGKAACDVYTGQEDLDVKEQNLNDTIRNDSLAWFLWLQTKHGKQVDLASLDSRLIASVALSPLVGENLRLDAAILGARKGMIDSHILESAFDSLSLKAQDIQSKAATLRANAALKSTPKNLALLYRASTMSDEKASKAALIHRGIDLSGSAFDSLALPYAAPLSNLPAEASHISLAFPASFLLYISGFYDNAAQWRALLKAEGGQDNAFLPYVLVAENPSASDAATDLSGWSQALAAQDPSDAGRRVKRILSALQPLGYKAGEESEKGAAAEENGEEKDQSSHPEALEHLKRIAGKGHKGETILLALAALGGTGPDKVDPELLEETLDALVSAGLDQEARLIAIEVIAVNIETKRKE